MVMTVRKFYEKENYGWIYFIAVCVLLTCHEPGKSTAKRFPMIGGLELGF